MYDVPSMRSASKAAILTTAVALTGLSVIGAGAALAETPAVAIQPGPVSDQLLRELLGLFVVATVMESALTLLFNWRLYREFCNGRAVKTLVMFGFGWAVVKGFDYDIFHRVVTLSGGKGDAGLVSSLLSAFVLAGGSTAVYELFKRLGLRAPVAAPEDTPQPGLGKAWVSVRIVPKRAIGGVRIHIEKLDNPTEAQLAVAPLAGVLAQRSLVERLKGVFTADPMRFPSYNGRAVEVGAVHRIVATGRRQGEGDGEPEDFLEEIYVGRFAERAIVDLVRTI